MYSYTRHRPVAIDALQHCQTSCALYSYFLSESGEEQEELEEHEAMAQGWSAKAKTAQLRKDRGYRKPPQGQSNKPAGPSQKPPQRSSSSRAGDSRTEATFHMCSMWSTRSLEGGQYLSQGSQRRRQIPHTLRRHGTACRIIPTPIMMYTIIECSGGPACRIIPTTPSSKL
eukprot:6491358-Amphidinium_carterae.7